MYILMLEDDNSDFSAMNPSSLDIFLSAVQRQKDMYKLYGSELTEDEGSPSTIENIIFCEATSHLQLEQYLNYFISSS
jgi:hypothetical protein